MANLVKYMMNSVNVFPLANDPRNVGNLVTEYNLRSLDSVMTPESVKYFIGMSYTHSESDFYVTKQKGDLGEEVGSDIITIAAGRAVINGHYFESIVPVSFTMAELNAQEGKHNRPALKGRIAVGLRAMYSTLPTLAGAMLTTGVEDKENYFEGVQVVVLPADNVITPTDSPNDAGKVNCHLLLAEFNYINQAITGEVWNNYPGKCQCIPATRVSDMDDLMTSIYVTRRGLNPKQLYVFSSKGDPTTKDTWCQATDSLIIWDNNPTLVNEKPSEHEAQFSYNNSGQTLLVMPHKQVDGILDSNSKPQYYRTKTTPLPLADYEKNTPGTVDRRYTEHVKEVERKIREIFLLPAGKQRGFLEELSDIADLPPIGPKWIPGDYIIVSEDLTMGSEYDSTRPPSTMYVVLPGQVLSIQPYTSFPSSTPPPGVRLGYSVWTDGSAPDKEHADVYSGYFNLSGQIYRGIIDQDYFEIAVSSSPDSSSYTHYYYTVLTVDKPVWSKACWLTAEIPFATESTIGGFYNVSDTAYGNGYVYLDSSGHLRMLDYDLLATGVLAYQLGSDIEIPASSLADIQTELNERVNQRVAFPSIDQNYRLQTDEEFTSTRNGGASPNVVNITLNLTTEDSEGSITIEDIDSRFNTSVCLILQGSANKNTTINIYDCQKIRIINKLTYEGDSGLRVAPKINVSRCCLYYDPTILDEVTIADGLTLWYERFEDTDPKLEIDGMTVREIDTPVSIEELEFWEEVKAENDNHYMYALHSLTFGGDGTIVGCELIVRNDTTANIDTFSQAVVAKFTLPTGVGLRYPVTKLKKPLKITGSFITAYPISDPKGWKIIDTNFTALTNTYDEYSTGATIDGVIAFYARIENLTNTIMPSDMHSIDGWDSNSFHIFAGGALT